MTIYNLIEHTLKAIPEIKAEYEDEAKWYRSIQIPKKRLDELATFAAAHNLPQTGDPIGVTIVFDNMVTPFVVSLAEDPRQRQRLNEVMEWIEELANSKDRWVRNIVAVDVCEPFLGSYQSKLKGIVPYMGETTKEFCRMQFDRWLIDDQTKFLFAQVE